MSDILSLTIKFLILIGDFVLVVFKLLAKLIKTIVSPIYSISKKILNLLYSLIFLSIIFPFKTASKTTTFIKNLRLKRLFVKRTEVLKIKKFKKIKPTKIFPVPVLFKIKYFIIGSLFSFIFFFTPLLFLIFLQELPNPKALALKQDAQTTKIYDRNDNLLFQIYASENRTFIPLSSIPKYMQEATIAIEDKDFYTNPGFNMLAIARAAKANLSGEALQGGSTITQQLIKSTLLTPELSLTRKIKEVILAFWTEKIYTKQQILEMYLNQIPYGGTAWGVEAAAQTYFGKNAKDLDLSESAFLASLPNAPTLYSPYGENPNLWKKRQKEVLEKMVDFKYISKNESLSAQKKELQFKTPQIPIHAPHFVMYVKDLLVKRYGLAMVEKGGLTVKTSLDLKTQEMAQKIVSEEVEKNTYLNLSNGAALITDPRNGDILAMIGSRDYSDTNGGNYNITTALRQPGSSIKVVTYSAALSNKFTASTIIDDSPISFTSLGAPTYSPVNYDGRFHGKMTLRSALANSVNIPAVKTLNAVGIPTMVGLAKKMGISTWGDPEQYGLAITLGAADVKMLDMTSVYGVFANQGVRVNINPILKITDYQGNVLEEKDEVEGKKVLDPGIGFIISDILADNNARAMEFGINSPLFIPNHKVSVKTGTSDNKRDNWTIGYTSSYVVAVWVGNNDNSPMSQNLASGITGAAPIWNRIMNHLISSLPDEKLPIPDDVVEKSCMGKTEYFIKGTESFVNCSQKITPSPTPN
ncbi:MAG: penicillin-binding protein [Candidatus Levybacteria bacterium]|nr:penicillin-binding protein [Candidatus Levybacteria bacterium]